MTGQGVSVGLALLSDQNLAIPRMGSAPPGKRRKKILDLSRVNVPNPSPCLRQAESWQPIPFYPQFSARGSLAETEASQRLVEAIDLMRIVYRSGQPQEQA
jgi:hypothetical protein